MFKLNLKDLVIVFEHDSDAELYREELEISKNYSSEKRISEFKKGRIAAKSALKKIDVNNFPILKAQNGEPIWPDGISGSISHSGEYAVAAVTDKLTAVGIDLESKLKKRDSKVFNRICTEKEQDWVGDSYINGIKIFSAKEAIYKAFIKLTRLGFHDVELCWEDGFFSCELLKNINQKYKSGFKFKVLIFENQDYIFSVCML